MDISIINDKLRKFNKQYKESGLNDNKILKKSFVGAVVSKSVSQYTLDGKWIRDWKSRLDACNELKIQSAHLNKCLKGTLPQAGGFVWTYNTGKKNISDDIEKRKKIYVRGKDKQKPILQYTLAGKFIKEWESSVQAGKALGKKSGSGINQCCRNAVKTQYGFIWKFK